MVGFLVAFVQQLRVVGVFAVGQGVELALGVDRDAGVDALGGGGDGALLREPSEPASRVSDLHWAAGLLARPLRASVGVLGRGRQAVLRDVGEGSVHASTATA